MTPSVPLAVGLCARATDALAAPGVQADPDIRLASDTAQDFAGRVIGACVFLALALALKRQLVLLPG